jgi:hypothetical protein
MMEVFQVKTKQWDTNVHNKSTNNSQIRKQSRAHERWVNKQNVAQPYNDNKKEQIQEAGVEGSLVSSEPVSLCRETVSREQANK